MRSTSPVGRSGSKNSTTICLHFGDKMYIEFASRFKWPGKLYIIRRPRMLTDLVNGGDARDKALLIGI